jgi:hypothetical protein
MKNTTAACLALTLLLAAQTAAADTAQTDGHGPRCRALRGVIVDSQVTQGCTSPNGFCAAGTVDANHGFNGTTYFVMDGAVRGPATAPGSLATTGLLTYTLRHGTLVVRESGLSGLSVGTENYFTAFQQVLSGTGRYEGATGFLYVLGQALPDHFDVEIQGELCTR